MPIFNAIPDILCLTFVLGPDFLRLTFGHEPLVTSGRCVSKDLRQHLLLLSQDTSFRLNLSHSKATRETIASHH